MKYKQLASKIRDTLLVKKKSQLPSPHSERAYAPLPTKVPHHVPTQATTTKKGFQEAKIVPSDWKEEVKQTSKCASHLDVVFSHTALVPNRVQLWKLKSYLYLLRTLQLMTKVKEMSKDISVIPSSPQNQQNQTQDELWRDMMKPHEERQFQIGRITNFFS